MKIEHGIHIPLEDDNILDVKYESLPNWESLMDYESEQSTHEDEKKRKIEQNSGHIGTSILDIRNKTTDRQAIKQEFRDYSADGIDEMDDDEYSCDRQVLSPEQVFEKFNGLFAFLGESTNGNPNLLEDFNQVTDKKGKLRFILKSSLADKVRLFCSEFDYSNYDNFMHRLQFQQDFINGTAKVWIKEWDSSRGEYIDVQRPLDSSDANRDDILLGLNRASLRSAMIGTPEYGAYEMSIDMMKDLNWSMAPDFPVIGGYWSGITNTSIGSWGTIIDEYGSIADKIARRNPDMSDEDLEHITVRKVARIFADSMEYNDTGRGPESPYVSSFHESVAWAQLGYGVQRRLRGMRQKIAGVDLHNIGRFLGRTGLNPVRASYVSERNRLQGDMQELAELENDGKNEELDNAIRENNEREIQKQNYWQEKETTRINHKYDKLISKTRSEERKAEYERRRSNELESLIADCNERREHFTHRTLDQLFSDINSRIEIIERRINKRKTIAEKAIDLHFALMPKYEEDDDDYDDDDDEYDSGDRIVPFQVSTNVDWINEAPFGLIRKAHKLLGKGLSQQELVTEAHRMSMDEVSFAKWAVSEVAQRMDNYRRGRSYFDIKYFDMAGASDFLRKTIGENFRYDIDTSEIKQKISENLYTFLPMIDNNRDVIPVPYEYFSSDEIAKSAVDHLRALTDSSLVADSVPRQGNDDDRWGGAGIAKKLIDGYILPNQPDFFQDDDNKAFILRMLRQSAFQMYDAGKFQEIISISEEYLPGIYNEQIEHLREIRKRLKEVEPASGSSWHERRLYENAVSIFSQIENYDGVDFPDPAKIIQLVENGMRSGDLFRGLGNGFNIEEIVKYPFLCSKLLKESNQGE